MRKRLLLAILVLALPYGQLSAQLFTFESDTVCIKQPVKINSMAPPNATYYWGFCSGLLLSQVNGTTLGNGFAFNGAEDIEVAKDDNGNYYGFVLNKANNEIIRLNYGNSLNNVPVIHFLNDVTGTLPASPSAMYLTRESGTNKWFMFVVGGDNLGNSTLGRLDFGTSLFNIPNGNNMGNIDNTLDDPSSIFVGEDNGSYYGYVINRGNDELVKLTFGNNIQLTPGAVSLGNVGAMDEPADMVFLKDGASNWHAAVVNYNSSTMSLMTFGNSLNNAPLGINIGNTDNRLFNPTAINHIKDCGLEYFFITNELSNDLLRITINDIATASFVTSIYPNPASFNAPSGMSRIIRDRDDLYSFVVNADNSLSKLHYEQCTNSSIVSSTDQQPPEYVYTYPGTYNVYLAVNEGLPDMQVFCDRITVLPFPGISFPDDTTLCQGDSANLFVQAAGGLSYTWKPNYNITDTSHFKIFAYPEYSTTYHMIIPYQNGCIVDTTVFVDVIKVKADAGPDRLISDGSATVLGGPKTTSSDGYALTWFPTNFLDEFDITNPTAKPLYDFTYYLQVVTTQKGFTCTDIDTVVVKTECDDIHLPNAFAPESSAPGVGKFGLLNNQLVKLNQFSIYDRWGKLVFETKDPQEEWDGYYNGVPAPVGVYVWVVDAFCQSGTRFTRSGNVTLLR